MNGVNDKSDDSEQDDIQQSQSINEEGDENKSDDDLNSNGDEQEPLQPIPPDVSSGHRRGRPKGV